MHDIRIRSRLKAQLTKFSSELCADLSKPLARFVSQMLFGIQSSQDVKLSNIGRSLQEEIPLIRTEKRLSRNLKSAELEKELTPQLVRMGSLRVQQNTVLALDLSDVRKEYAQKMENLATVRDGSTGELHLGYWLCDVTAAEVGGSEIVPLYQKLFSVEAEDFTSENAEVLAAVDLIRTHTRGRGIWTIDRGGDRKKLLEPLLDRGERFVIRSTGKRTVIDRRKLQGSVAEVAGRCRLPQQARIIKIQDGQEKVYDLRYGAEPIRLPGRSEQLWLVVIAGFGEAPLMLLTNLPVTAKDSQSLVDRANLPDALENWRVQSRTHCPVGERPTGAKRLRPCSWGGVVARKQDDGALRQHARKGVCATHQVATYSERRRSLVTRISGG